MLARRLVAACLAVAAVTAVTAVTTQPALSDESGRRMWLSADADCSRGVLSDTPVEGRCTPQSGVAVYPDGAGNSRAMLGATYRLAHTYRTPADAPAVRHVAGRDVTGTTSYQAPDGVPHNGMGTLRVSVALDGFTPGGERVRVGRHEATVELPANGAAGVVQVPFRIAVPGAVAGVLFSNTALHVELSGMHARTAGIRYGTWSFLDLPG